MSFMPPSTEALSKLGGKQSTLFRDRHPCLVYVPLGPHMAAQACGGHAGCPAAMAAPALGAQAAAGFSLKVNGMPGVLSFLISVTSAMNLFLSSPGLRAL